jgi:hypothetical protein
MVELSAGGLRLVGLHDDGEHLVLAGAGGEKFMLPITDALRAAVRRDRPQMEQIRSTSAGFLPPREIQARVRAGQTAEEIAAESGITVEQVHRYDGPVLAEREFVASQAAATRVGKDDGSPTLGDLVTDRLAARGVDTDSLEWDSARPDGHGWIVSVTFEVGGTERVARWTFDHATHTLHALEDEARWLSETEIADEPIPRRHLSAVRGAVFDVEVDGSVRPVLDAVDETAHGTDQAPVEDDATAALLDDLQGRRGVRQQVDLDDDGVFEGFGPPSTFDLGGSGHPRHGDDVPGAHPAAGAGDPRSARVFTMPSSGLRPAEELPDDVGDTSSPGGGADGPAAGPASGAGPEDGAEQTDLVHDDGGPDDPPAPKARAARRARSKVPSWDEIVFGAKPDQ